MSDLNIVTHAQAQAAIDRLFKVALGDTGQSRVVANFLLAWWNAQDHGGFDVAELFSVDTAISDDMALVFLFISQRGTAIYLDAFDRRTQTIELIRRWRRPDAEEAA